MSLIAEVTWCRGQQWSPFLQTSVRCIGLQGDTCQACVLIMSAVHSSALSAIFGFAGGHPCVYRWSPSQAQIPTTLQPFSSLRGNFCVCPGVSFQVTVGTLLHGGHFPMSFVCVLPAAFPFLISLSASPSEACSWPLRNSPHARAENKSCLFLWTTSHDPNTIIFLGQ